MNLTVPTNWDDDLLDAFADINSNDVYTLKIGQVYGAVLTNFGDGRMETPELEESRIKHHIRLIQDLGVPFNFLLNAPSMGGVEHDREYRAAIVAQLKWIEALGVDMVTVSNPFLGELVQHHCPELDIKISTITDVKSVQSVGLLEKLGPNITSATLSYNVNREFQLLCSILDVVEFDIELLANIICLLNCPYQSYHYDLVGSYARLSSSWNPPFKDYCPLGCDSVRLKNPEEVVKTPWIRPEDTKIYGNIGVSSIKIAGRTLSTSTIINIVQAYAQQKYDGNLWDLIAPWIPINLPNNVLDNFINFFVDKTFSCNDHCGQCHYCNDIASQYVSYGPERDLYLDDLEARLSARLEMQIHLERNQYLSEEFFV